MMEWLPEFRVGRGRLQVSFTGGHLCGGACTPASYETSDPVVQKVIESSVHFRQGRIRLVMEDGHTDRPAIGSTMLSGAATPEPASEGVLPECVCGVAANVTDSHKGFVFEYSTLDDISDFLQFGKSVPLDRLHSEEDCFREAERLGIVLKKKDS